MKNQRYPKKDYLSYESLSTEKTYNAQYKKKLRYPKTEKKISKSKIINKNEDLIIKTRAQLEREKNLKSNIKSQSVVRKVRNSSIKNIDIRKKTNRKKKRRNKKKKHTIISFKNPFFEEEKEKEENSIYESSESNYDSDSLNDSDYDEEDIKKEKSIRKSTTKKIYTKEKKNIEMKEIIWHDNDINLNSSDLEFNYLPCREKEQEKIYDYIKRGLLTNGNYNSLYIAGMPGTGKTACVKTVINIIELEIKQNNQKNISFPPFTKIFLCGTEYPSILTVFRTIYNYIFSTKKRRTNKKYISLLNRFFFNRNGANIAHLNDPSNSHIILVIDEIDFLINKSQKLLYNIFNWTTFEGSKLIVISISNTLDLPNKLSPKIKSRMGNNKIMFKPYNKDELITILKSKGVEYNSFTQDALKLSCMKVASINGDLRRIIQILQRAKEIYSLSSIINRSEKIDKTYILKACDDLYNSKLTRVIKSLQISEKIIICTVLSRYKDVNENKVKIEDLFEKKDIFITKYNEYIGRQCLNIYWDEYQRIIYNLIRLQLLSFYDKPINNNFMENYITIKFYTDEFIKACDDDIELKPVLEYLINLISI